MGFLTPLFLVAAVAVAVPLILHLLHLRSGKRQPFPALRYLRRTEKEHARRIRLRQLLLLLLRITAILLLVAAGARLFLADRQGDHEPTALVVVLDNSVSSGTVVGEERILDVLKRSALESVDAATEEDRIWVLRAGEPWNPPLPGSRSEARGRILETEPAGTSSDLRAVLARARSLAATAGMPAREVHLLSDLQASAFSRVDGESEEPAGSDVPLLVLETGIEPPPNRWVASVEVGGGLSPLVGDPTGIVVRVERTWVPARDGETGSGETGSGETGTGETERALIGDTVRVRLRIGGRTTSAADAPLGSDVVLPAGPFARETVAGLVEVDPDALRADDRRYFAFDVRPPTAVGIVGDGGLFLSEAMGVLEEEGRIRAVLPGEAEVLLSLAGEGLGPSADPPAVIVPSPDPALVTATNVRLREAGIPWTLEPTETAGETRLENVDAPVDLDEARVRTAYRLSPTAPSDTGEVRIRTGSGEPWMVSGTTPGGRSYLLVASPLTPEATSLAVSAEMVPLVEWMVSGWSPTFQPDPAVLVGEPFRVAAGATEVRTPGGTAHPVDGRQPFRATGSPGIYEVLRGDSVVDHRAVNVPESESMLTPLEGDGVLELIPPPARLIDDPARWSSRIFLERRGREPWRLLLLAALLVLVGESLAAAGGGRTSRKHESPSTPPSPASVP